MGKSFRNKLTFGKRMQVVTDPNAISDAGIDEIKAYISRANLRNSEWKSILPEGYDPYDFKKDRLPPLPDEWDWVMNSTSKTPINGVKYTGRFTRRVSAYFFKTTGLSVPESWLTQLGNIVSSHSEKNAGYHIDFTEDLHSWRAGDFGDRGSCFWQGREAARDVMEKNGCIAIRFYENSEPNAKGVARAWIVPDYPEDGLAMVWNGYGFAGDPTRIIARVLMEHVKEEHYRQVTLYNNGRETGDVYINGGRGYIVGDATKAKQYSTCDFNWSERVLGRCPHCGEIIYLNEEDDCSEYNGRYYHDACFHECFFECAICGSSHPNESAETIEKHTSVGGGTWIEMRVCEHCASAHSTECEHCGRDTHNGSIRIIDGDHSELCVSCHEEHVGVCDNCGTEFLTENLTQSSHSHDVLCEVCHADEEDMLENDDELVGEEI